MKVLVYADFRSPHARGWTEGLRSAGLDVIEVSSELADGDVSSTGVSRLTRLKAKYVNRVGRPGAGARSPLALMRRQQWVHTLLAVLRFRGERRRLLRHVAAHEPDLVHALRIPYEGLTALSCKRLDIPIIVSAWGQDFILQAARDPLLRIWMRWALPTAGGMHADNPDDFRRAKEYGLSDSTPLLHAAGNFGVDTALFFPVSSPKVSPPLIVCVRRPAPNIDLGAFLRMVRELDSTGASFALLGVDAQNPILDPVRHLLDQGRLTCFAEMGREEFAELLRRASVAVSPSTSDGMPNSVLEAVACGAGVVAGELEQLRPLALNNDIRLVDLDEPGALSSAVTELLSSTRAFAEQELADEYNREFNKFAVPNFYKFVVDPAEGEGVR